MKHVIAHGRVVNGQVRFLLVAPDHFPQLAELYELAGRRYRVWDEGRLVLDGVPWDEFARFAKVESSDLARLRERVDSGLGTIAPALVWAGYTIEPIEPSEEAA